MMLLFDKTIVQITSPFNGAQRMKLSSHFRRGRGLPALLAAAAVLFAATARGDEGMWLFNNPPKTILKQRYGFQPPASWYEHLQRSSVRFNEGGSGSFVSSHGLVLTNHHIGVDALQKLSTKEKNYVADGFYAKTEAEEIKCVDVELNVLMSIEDVTARVNAAVPPGADLVAAETARRAVMNTIEQEATEKTGLRCDVITLFQGGQYQLYRYKRYTDVRLVFAPEEAVGNFGGDPDNFEYPRYDLDICLFRVYENGRPAKIEHFLQWAPQGAADGELVFVSGNPAKTDRLDTVAHLQFIRDVSLPLALNWLMRNEVLLTTYGQRSEENQRRCREELFYIQNSPQGGAGPPGGPAGPGSDGRKADRGNGPPQSGRCRSAAPGYPLAGHRRFCLGRSGRRDQNPPRYSRGRVPAGRGPGVPLPPIQGRAIAPADGRGRCSAKRAAAARVPQLEPRLAGAGALFPGADLRRSGDHQAGRWPEPVRDIVGADNELVRKVLAGKSPQERAGELIRGTRLDKVAVRREIARGGLAAVRASDDPMVKLARLVDGPARLVRRTKEQQVDEPLRQAYAKIAQARFAVSGNEIYPDATFTLRLSFGVVKGYDAAGRHMPPWTTLGRAFEHAAEHHNQEPFNLPPSWLTRKAELDLSTPLNFLATTDIIGGNSGSPVVNRQGQFVGIIFDGNLESLVWDFVFTEKTGRAIAVHAAAIDQALRKIYGAARLADELGK